MNRPLPRRAAVCLAAIAMLCPTLLAAQLSDRTRWAVDIMESYWIAPNNTYLTANNWDAKLDVYVPGNAVTPLPTLVYFHGGGWVEGSKDGAELELLPYLANGWVVVNVAYRLARISPAPAAVEDTRCALRWVVARAKDYHIDTTRIVVTGHSAGGHLSLMAGMTPASAGLDRQCNGTTDVRVAAVINWYGITDVGDLLDGPNMQSYAVSWLGSHPDREAVAKRVSPLTYVRPGLPPILTIHGDADKVVPYSHAERLHAALRQAGVPNQLLTIPSGGHGGFSHEENTRAYAAIEAFLRQHGVLPAR